ncbi:hypothetical protein GCM10023169_31440 [Georgenia halophila]|uniref:Cupin type-2 domain-containing protein n=2 Tax=Georgenia halophila TaxID=620889 RepID=A0ABP8LJ45_9MICO
MYAHDGEEVGYISEGRLELAIEDDVHVLETADSFHFDCNRSHSHRNPATDRRTVVVWCVTPPPH